MIRIRFSYSRGDALKYLSHLDMLRLFHRALRRAALPAAYSLGFNPHPRLNLAAPLPVGVTASREYGDAYFTEPLQSGVFLEKLGGQLPAGLALTGAAPVSLQEPSLSAVINAALYQATWSGSGPVPEETALRAALERLLHRPVIKVQRRGKKNTDVEKDIRPYILRGELLSGAGQPVMLSLLLQTGSSGGVSPFLVLEQLVLEQEQRLQPSWRVHRQGLYIYSDGLEEPLPEGGEISHG